MQECLRHRGLVNTLDTSIEAIVGSLECHLHEGIGTEPMASDKVLAITLELESLAVVLADEIAKAGLGEADTCAQLGGEPPFEFLGRRVDRLGFL
jgi:hypothetical protein